MDKNKPYVLWRRISTKQQKESVVNIDTQESIAEYFIGSKPVRIFTDVYSSIKLSECPKLNRAIKFCRTNNYILVIAKIDLIRNIKEALDILDQMGEGNLLICDLPTTDRTALTIMGTILERRTIIDRIDSKLRYDELRKNGKVIGRLKGCDTSIARNAGKIARIDRAASWKKNSKAYLYAIKKKAEGRSLTQTANDLKVLYRDNPEEYGTVKGCCPSKGTISRWWNDSDPL